MCTSIVKERIDYYNENKNEFLFITVGCLEGLRPS